MDLRYKPFPSDFFITNRQNLAALLSSKDIVLLQAAGHCTKNSDQLFPWRQESSFFYLTGIEHSDCKLVMLPDGKGGVETTLFIPPIDPYKEKWEGKMLTKEQATAISGIETVHYTDSFEQLFLRMQRWRDNLYCTSNEETLSTPNDTQHEFILNLSRRIPGLQIRKLDPILIPLRMHKSEVELEYIQKAIDITDTALGSLAAKIAPGVHEYELEAALTHDYIRLGCVRHGFEPIVASGGNATVLHYTSNASTLASGDLLLVDTGGEYGMYSADITRVYPVDGAFSGRGKHCYETNLEIQEDCIAALKPGISLKDLKKQFSEIQGKILEREKFVAHAGKHEHVSFHGITHSLGLDVHDSALEDLPLQEGMLLTIEPGLYLPEEGIGIRIEDDLLLTADGSQNLSEAIPKQVADIEQLLSKS